MIVRGLLVVAIIVASLASRVSPTAAYDPDSRCTVIQSPLLPDLTSGGQLSDSDLKGWIQKLQQTAQDDWTNAGTDSATAQVISPAVTPIQHVGEVLPDRTKARRLLVQAQIGISAWPLALQSQFAATSALLCGLIQQLSINAPIVAAGNPPGGFSFYRVGFAVFGSSVKSRNLKPTDLWLGGRDPTDVYFFVLLPDPPGFLF